MKVRLMLISVVCFLFVYTVQAETPSLVKTPDGIIVYTDPLYTGASNAVRLEVISDNIIRVTAAPAKEFSSGKSLITVYAKKPKLSWDVVSSKGNVSLKT